MHTALHAQSAYATFPSCHFFPRQKHHQHNSSQQQLLHCQLLDTSNLKSAPAWACPLVAEQRHHTCTSNTAQHRLNAQATQHNHCARAYYIHMHDIPLLPYMQPLPMHHAHHHSCDHTRCQQAPLPMAMPKAVLPRLHSNCCTTTDNISFSVMHWHGCIWHTGMRSLLP